MNKVSWCFQHYNPSLENQQFVMKQILDENPTENFFKEQSVRIQ